MRNDTLRFDQRDYEGIRIIDLHGQLVEGDSESGLRNLIESLAGTGVIYILLNLAAVTKLDGAGLEALVLCEAEIQEADGVLRLMNLNLDDTELTIVTKLETVFTIFQNELDAVNSFFPDRAVRHFDILEFVKEQEKTSK